jgi:hypothetical protein
LQLALALLWPILSFAQAGQIGDYCTSLSVLKAQVTSCARNHLYVEAAAKCVAKVDARAKGVLLHGLQKNLVGNDTASTSAQHSKASNAQADLKNADTTTTQVYSEVRQALAETKAYLKHFAWPGRFSDKVVEKNAMASVLATIPCYADNQKALELEWAKLDQRAAELERTDSKLTELEGKTNTVSTSLQGKEKLRKGPAALGAGKSKKPRQNESTITGIKEKPKKP